MASVLTACSDQNPTARPQVSSSPNARLAVRSFTGGDVDLPAGTYRHPDFKPSFTFEIGDDWQGHHDQPGEFFNLSSGEVLVAFARPTFVPGAGRERIPIAGLDLDRIIDLIAQNADLGAQRLRALDIDGRPAPRLELRPTRPRTTVFGSEDGDFGAFPNHRYRIIGLQFDGMVLLGVAEAAAAPFDEHLDRAERVISSVRRPGPAGS